MHHSQFNSRVIALRQSTISWYFFFCLFPFYEVTIYSLPLLLAFMSWILLIFRNSIVDIHFSQSKHKFKKELSKKNLGALVTCCIASCGEERQAVDHDPLFPHHKRIFEAILKCLTEENEEIQDTAFSALKEVVFYLNLSSNSLCWAQ